jgi:Flp pilus assembly protein CpaB
MLLIVGVAAFLVGVALVMNVLRADDGKQAAKDTEVLIATQPIAAGASGTDVVNRRIVTLRSVPANARAKDVLTDPAALSGRIIDVDIAAGGQIVASALRPQTLRAGAITIPPGKQGVAVQLPFVAGGGGYVGAGDLVNIYANVSTGQGTAPVTKLVLGNIKVLDVSTEVAPRVDTSQGERPAGSNVTYLLALDANEAERVIYLSANAQMWLALQNADAQPLPATSGRTNTDVLK